MRRMTAKEVSEHLREAEEPPLLLDVREPWEHRICLIEGSERIPMGQVPHALERLDREAEIVVICHHGVRSYYVASFLEQAGFSRVVNLEGGIDAWAREVDPAMSKY